MHSHQNITIVCIFLFSRAVQIREDLWWLLSGSSKGQPRTEVFHRGVFLEGPDPPEDADLAEACVVLADNEKVNEPSQHTQSIFSNPTGF